VLGVIEFAQSPDRHGEPQDGERERSKDCRKHTGGYAEQLRGDEQQATAHRQCQKRQASDHHPVRVEHDVVLVVVSKQETMLGGGRDRAHRCKRSEHERYEIDSALEASDMSEAGVERDDQQKREENLYAGDDDAQLACELLEIAVEALV
jgi:hypothetical protein